MSIFQSQNNLFALISIVNWDFNLYWYLILEFFIESHLNDSQKFLAESCVMHIEVKHFLSSLKLISDCNSFSEMNIKGVFRDRHEGT